MAYGIASWGKALTDVWGEVSVENKRVLSYTFDRVPESVSVFPSAISFVMDVNHSYSLGGVCFAVFHGRTHFHITSGLVRSQMGFVMKFINEIVKAAAGHLTLGGLVTDFRITSMQMGMDKWGNEDEHFVIEVDWTVEESQSGKYTVSA